MSDSANTPVKNIVLVHGGFVDGAGWRGVYDILKRDGFNVSIAGRTRRSGRPLLWWRGGERGGHA